MHSESFARRSSRTAAADAVGRRRSAVARSISEHASFSQSSDAWCTA